ncbi:prenyltransferase [Thiomicrospira sp. ALE5]|uniref:prenyltransferase n=1 Tax=Thiomicrospira sp. ALE5 TaxID=748650 RepID=UPI0008E88839|nr:prenyltransferase [Thiomicrospira sp. ALE5]SFR50211.1 1,4-dihydroxy-2-naphthoate octaprenyltransferase [Thiomicrospira sp. ALE5]
MTQSSASTCHGYCTIRALWHTSRPNFLILALVVTALTVAWLVWAGFELSPGLVLMVSLAALVVHASVNWLNEVHDARTGLDQLTQRTPFNGGSGALQGYPEALKNVQTAAYIALAVAVGFGIYLVWLWDWRIIPLGLLGLVVILSYSPWMTRQPVWGWSSPGLGLGWVLMLGVAFALTGHYPTELMALALLPFLLINNLLLLNQFPDKQADQQVGRRTLPLAVGDRHALWVFKASLLVSVLLLVGLIGLGVLPWLSLMALVGFVPAGLIWSRLQPGFELRKDVVFILAMNVMMILGTLALLAVSLLINAWIG